ncbi:lipid A biosynthesis lauroyl acyltransferase [Lentilitoribacter sp. Alg239-R112]|uniref:lipid A biosynthesis lauroyl acyltransferase n=1 Tax=Lentilitoribacter sp. Alg239-R112 TaxID=2305987 RepID=UPI0021109185|nr:lipid A biosynthesis lauroyl acyltransferase [Lentilitoribacter sp. Alg239-R112]
MLQQTPSKFSIKLYNIATNIRYRLEASVAISMLNLARLLPVQTALSFMDKITGFVGPRTSRQKLALKNVALAFPEKSEEEREEIVSQMWSNMSRLGAEYIFLDKISKYDPENPDNGNIEVIGTDIFLDLMENPRPFIVFTMHAGNFELLPIVSQKYGLSVSALFRPPNNPYIAKKIFSARGAHVDDLVPSTAGAAWTLAHKLDQNGGVGMLVDQKFDKRGADTTFFGHKVRTNPLLAKLARQYECDVFPARCIRLPEGRFRIELEPAIDIPKNADGVVDINATCQLLNDKVEDWVREYPGQWQWFHDRWNIKHTL